MKKIYKKILFFGINPFIFALVQYNGDGQIQNSWNEIQHFITTTTSIECEKEIKKLHINEEIFSYPFLVMTGREEFNNLTEKEIKILRQFLSAGGLLFIDNSLYIKNSGFDKAIRREIIRIFPDKELKKINNNHALFYSFYLLPKVSGCRILSKDLYGIEIDNQLAVIYSLNNLLGTWERDKLGNWLYECNPGGEKQRLEAMKLTVNIIMYVLTGSYKLDAIHSPFIQKKLKEMKK